LEHLSNHLRQHTRKINNRKSKKTSKGALKMNARKNIILILAALALTLGAASGIWIQAQAAQVANCTQTYTVKAGDTLAKIAAANNTTWRTLAEINKIENANRIYTGQVICLAVSATTPVPTTPAPTTPARTPTISIQSVVKDTSVSIRTANYPANRTFDVLMGAMGTRGVNGVKVGTLESGAGGTLDGTYNIPASLQGSSRIAIRLQSTTGGYFSYNWFHNTSTAVATPAPTTPAPTAPAPTTPAARVPTISILSVAKDTTVTIRTANYPANRTFEVLMGPMGTRGVNGVKVGTLETGSGGTLQATFNIPASLQGSKQIAIRLQSTTGGYFSYNWFYNN
jgi:LysM repeat protein